SLAHHAGPGRCRPHDHRHAPPEHREGGRADGARGHVSARRERGTGRSATGGSSPELDLFSVAGSDGQLEVTPPVRSRRRQRAATVSQAEPIVPTDPGSRAESAIPIATLTRIAKDVVEGAFTPLWVRGEVSAFKAHRNGHWY